MVRELAALDIPAFSNEIYRTEERQAQLLRAGRSKVSFGAHNVGMATDVVHSLFAWDMSEVEWRIFGVVGFQVAARMKIRVVWGGDESKLPGAFSDPADSFRWDPAHWELADWRG